MTANIEHTKAPWYVSLPDTVRGQEPRIREFMHAVRDDKTGKEICVITRNSTPRDELQANAQIIAAAPEMLEALEELDNILKGAIHNNMLETVSPALLKAKNAIDKARGKS